ncbi:MAG: hypothetical protein HY744_09515 [Deltaproteobacteria bacterium]|nr:hypothetical protein [Deltaproteobacteria bacterium]
MPFDRERLDVYQAALDFFDLADPGFPFDRQAREGPAGRRTKKRERERERARVGAAAKGALV